MSIAVLPDDEGACGHYRLIWPGRQLAAHGHVTVLPVHGLNATFIDAPDGTAELIDVDRPDADILVVQRVLRREILQAIPILQAKGVRVVVDIDDDFAALHPRNSGFQNCHPSVSPTRNHQILTAACAIADWVTVTTPALAHRYGRHGRVSVVPNRVPGWYLDVTTPPHDGRPVTIGWTGSIDTHPTDLQATGGALVQVCRDTDAVFDVVGTGVGVGRALGFNADPAGPGWLSLADYPKAMAGLDIGIVPLDDIAFNHAKSALKVLEFAALGVPVVASPTPDNSRMAKLGACRLAGRRREWVRELRQLVDSPTLRAELAGRARQVMADHTIGANLESWWTAWTAPATTRRPA